LPRKPDIVGDTGGLDDLAAAAGHECDETPQFRPAFDGTELHDIAVHQIGKVRLVETGPAPSRPCHRLGKTTTGQATDISAACLVRVMCQIRSIAEGGVDDPVGGVIDLALRQGPQLDGFHASGERVRKARRPRIRAEPVRRNRDAAWAFCR
jgi:hypothetical protein